MAIAEHAWEIDSRRTAMLRTAFCSVIRNALDAPDTIEITANPDGSVWIEKAGIGLVVSEHRLDAADRERVIRLVASGVGEVANRAAPIVSAELPASVERFAGLLPPVSTAPCFSIRKPATTPFELGDYVDQGAMSPALCAALRESVANHSNILIAGGNLLRQDHVHERAARRAGPPERTNCQGARKQTALIDALEALRNLSLIVPGSRFS